MIDRIKCAGAATAPVRFGVKNEQIQEIGEDEADWVLENPANLYGSHVNSIPLQPTLQSTRQFYGARFFNQAVPQRKGEAPLVQNLAVGDKEGRSFDDIMGQFAGALRSKHAGKVVSVEPRKMVIETPEGKKEEVAMYNNFTFNRKTGISHRPRVKVGDEVTPGQLLASSNYTDDNGTLAMGLNARIGLVPFKGFSMDDAVVISEGFAKRLDSEHTYTNVQDFDDNIRGGLNHFRALFPDKFNRSQLENMDNNGVVKPGTILKPGDPMILATRPRVLSSASAQLGRLSRAMRTTRTNASQTWEGRNDAEVTDVAKTKDGYKVVVKTFNTTKPGDKIVMRSGQKGVVSVILPDEQMLRTADGKPMDVLLNPLGIPSRANSSLPYELLLGKVARKMGQPLKLAAYTAPGRAWYDEVADKLAQAGLEADERVFDPMEGRPLENPITVGEGYIMKLHHTADSKANSRSQGGYDAWEQPLRGGGEGAGAKRLSGLEVGSLMSAGAYATLREGATLRGQKNDDYWRKLRAGQTARPQNRPFAWDKFRAMLTGAGLRTKDMPGGVVRLGPVTDRDLTNFNPVEIRNGGLINLDTFEPDKGGLFDPAVVGGNRWGRIPLPFPVPNPAFEDTIRHLLGMKKQELRDVMAGKLELPPHLRGRAKFASATFHRPENFEKIKDIKAEQGEFYVASGANDWETGVTWAAVYPKDAPCSYGDPPRVWIEIDHADCPACHGSADAPYDDQKECWAFGEKVVKDWVRRGLEDSSRDEWEWGFEIDDNETMDGIKHIKSWGVGMGKEKSASVLSPPTTGPEAIFHALANLNTSQLERDATQVIKSKKVTKRPAAVQVLNALEGLKRNEVKPQDLMIRSVPVLPPAFRPFSMLGNTFVPGDANELYRDLFDLRDVHKDASNMFGEAGSVKERMDLYDSVKALYGYGDAVKPKTRQRGVSGFLKQVTGTNPKFSVVQRKLISKPQDSVSRGVITIGADLGMDEIGVPEEMVWKMYNQYIQRRLSLSGMAPAAALRHITERSPHAKRALDMELEHRPIIYSRAPSWHKYNVVSGKVKMIPGDTISINPFVTTGLNADFDGDTLNLHVPSQPDAVEEARTILRPSNMTFSIRDQDKVVPTAKHEQVLGLYTANSRPAKQVHKFNTMEEALAAIQSKKISLSDEIEIPDKAAA